MTMPELTMKRKADRTKLALMIEEMLKDRGVQFERREGGDYPGPREIQIHVVADRGVRVGVDLDGDSCQPNTFVLTWNAPDGVCFSEAMGMVNPYHFAKATTVAHGADQLLYLLDRDLEAFRSGRGFDDERVKLVEAREAARRAQTPIYANEAQTSAVAV
jgi:hypothetical protein